LIQRRTFPHFKISKIEVCLTSVGVSESMSENYIVRLKHNEYLDIHNTRRGALTTKISTQDIPEVFLCISVVKNVVICDNV
jgi:hypothetical protein